ncbi:MAG TPA: HEAT repeat domain-containing protein [Polyangia bacterium]
MKGRPPALARLTAFVAGVALAATTKTTTATAAPDPPAAAVGSRVSLRITPERHWELSIGGGTPLRLPLTTMPARRGKPSVQDVATREGRVIAVRAPVMGRPTSEVWLGTVEGNTPKQRWVGFVGAKDADGENLVHLEIASSGIQRYETLARVTGCDGAPVRLFPARFDLASNAFVATAPPPPPPARTTLSARRQEGRASPKPRIAFPFTIASALAADVPATGTGDVNQLVAPLAISDGDTTTAWVERAGEGGAGGVLTARAGGADLVVTGLSLLPGAVESAQSFAAHGRARRIAIALGPEPEKQFEVQLENVDDVAARSRPYLIKFPKPIASSCVSLVAREVVPGQTSPATVAWSDVTVLTDLDSSSGSTRFLEELAGADCRERVGDARSLGASAGPKIVTALTKVSGPGPARGCLLDALLRIADPQLDAKTSVQLGEALPALLAQGLDASEKRALHQLLERSSPPPVSTLGQTLADQAAAEPVRIAAARALAQLKAPNARAALLASVGEGPTAVRQEIRRQLALATSEEVRTALSATPPTAPRRRAELLAILGESMRRTGVRPDGVSAGLASVASDESTDFIVRGRAVQALAAAGDATAVAALDRLSRPPVEPALRLLATRSLGRVAAGKGAENTNAAAKALRNALADSDPAVREAAAEGLGLARDQEASALLVTGAKQEPWPMVRRAELEALGILCGPGAGDLLARAVERDVPDLRRVGLTGLFACKDERAVEAALALLRRPDEPPPLRSHAASLLGTSRRTEAAKGLAGLMEDLTNQAPTDPAFETVALAAIRALAVLGGADAETQIVALHNHPHTPVRRAALQALGQLCKAPTADAALRAASLDADPVIAATARASARQCRIDVGSRPSPEARTVPPDSASKSSR